MTHVPDATTRDSARGHVGAMTQRLVNGRSLDLSLRTGPMHAFQVRAWRAFSAAQSRLRALTPSVPSCAVPGRGRRQGHLRPDVFQPAPEPSAGVHRHRRIVRAQILEPTSKSVPFRTSEYFEET